MNIYYFNEYIAHCQKIELAFSHLHLLQVDTEAIFAAWEEGGLFGFSKDERGALQSWLNVVAHMSVSAVLGAEISCRLIKELRNDASSPLYVVHALLVHDWSKRLDSEYRIKSGADEERVGRFEANNITLLKRSFPDMVVRLAGAAGGSGMHLAETRGFALDEKIVFLCDYCTHESSVVSFERRLKELEPHFKPGGRYAGAEAYYRQRFGVSHNEKLASIFYPMEKEIGCLLSWSGTPGELALSFAPEEFRGA